MDYSTGISVAILLLLGAGVIFWAWWAWQRTPFTPVQAVLYSVNVLLARCLWRTTVRGKLSLPADVGAVIVCNHRCSVDPLFIQLSTHRVVHWLVAREYCEHPALAGIFRATQSIPVGRGGVDTAATKLAIRIVQRGGIVGLFPEGRINTTDELLLPGRQGAALIALKAKSLVVPCYIAGAPRSDSVYAPLITPARVEVIIGEPLDITEYHGREGEDGVLDELCERLQCEIARLAGQEDFIPSIASRRRRRDAGIPAIAE